MEDSDHNVRTSFPKIPLRTLSWGSLIALIFLVLASAAFVYLAPAETPGSARLRTVLPFPMALVDFKKTITFRGLGENIGSVRHFYEAQNFAQVGMRVDFSTEDGEMRLKIREKEVFNKMIEDAAIAVLAGERGIRVTSEAAHLGLARKLEEYGKRDEVVANLKRLYGWSLADFEEKIVLPGLYEEKLTATFEKENDIRGAAEAKIREAKKALDNRLSFADTAREFSEGETREAGGELGWFTLTDLAPELQSAASRQTVGTPGDIIESGLGFHILLVEKKEENAKELYRLSQIFTRKPLFADWLTERMREMNIVVWSPEYYFDRTSTRAEFRDQQLRDFEAKLREEGGDSAFFF